MRRPLLLLLVLFLSQVHAPADLLSEFQNPPREYSPVPIWWWSGEKIEKDRLPWQMERMVEGHVYNAIVLNLNPSSDQPTYFSPEWWDLMDFTLAKAEKLGMRIWFYDQIGFARSGICDQIMAANPSFRAETLGCRKADASGGTAVELHVPEGARLISATAIRGQKLGKAAILSNQVQGNTLRWTPPVGQWQVMLFYAQPAEFDFSNPQASAELMNRIYGEYERRFGKYLGNVIPGSFQDELPAMPRWSKGFLEEFKKRKGYDLTPYLPALFYDFGPETAKYRLDYRDVMAGMCEDAFFKPCFEWHARHGMICGMDQSVRDADPIAAQNTYTDYFRTMRWYGVPGQDQNGDPKIRASIAHLYGRPRVWQEGFHSTGWGQTLEELADLVDAFYLRGANLYNPHAWYYSTAGSWWEFAPPCTSFRQPYWMHYSHFADYVARMSFLLSQGSHVCDIGVLYPSATIQADMTIDGKVSPAARKTDSAFWSTLNALDKDDRDYDWIDESSVENAVVKDGRLCAGSEQYRVLVLPGEITPKTTAKIAEFARSGGTVIAAGPEALPESLAPVLARDWSPNVRCLHRYADGLHVYFTLRSTEEEVEFRAKGKPEIWDPYTGKVHPVAEYSITDSGTKMRLDFDLSPAYFIVIKPSDTTDAKLDQPNSLTSTIPIEGEWDFELRPTMDNRWGDFRYPPSKESLPVETREFRYAADPSDEGLRQGWNKPEFDDWKWERTVFTFGPYWLESEWMKDAGQPTSWQHVSYSKRFGIDHDLIFGGVRFIADGPITFQNGQSNLKKMRTGSMYGPKGRVPAEFVDLGTGPAGTVRYLSAFAYSPKAQKARMHLDCLSDKQVWVNDQLADETVDLKRGWNKIMVKVWRGSERSRVSFALTNLQDEGSVTKWIWDKDPNAPTVTFRKVISLEEPGQARINITCDNGYELSANGVLIDKNPDCGTTNRRSGDSRSFALTKGPNTIEIKGTNSAGRGGLLLWGDINFRSGKKQPIVSDESWQVVGSKEAAVSYGTMYSSPWNPIRWGVADQGAPRMPTDDLPGIVYDPYPDKVSYAWYRFDLPPGTQAMKLSLAVPCEIWVNGVRERMGKDGRVILDKPALNGGICAVKVRERPGFRAGAVFNEAVQFDCGPGRINLGSWHEKGLQTYSGIGVYSRTLDLPADVIGKPLTLDLGEVRGTAEVMINGRSAGVRIWRPYRFEIDDLIRAGDNRLEVTVTNTLGPHYSVGIPTPYVFPGQEVSGILGPVSLQVRAD